MEVNFNSWYELLYRAYGEKAIIPACYLIASAFRDSVFKTSEEHFFPLLYLCGPAYSGKSTIARNIAAVLGEVNEINLRDIESSKELTPTFQQPNSITILDEWGPAVEAEIKRFVKDCYSNENANGIVITTHYHPINIQQYHIVQYMSIEQKSKEQTLAYRELISLSQDMLANIKRDLLQHRELIEEEFENAQDKVFNHLYDNLTASLARDVDNMAVIIAPAYILLKHEIIKMMNPSDLLKIAEQNVKDMYKCVVNFKKK